MIGNDLGGGAFVVLGLDNTHPYLYNPSGWKAATVAEAYDVAESRSVVLAVCAAPR